VAEERLHIKQRLAAALRLFARYGLDEGVAGHMTARDPEHPDRFWCNSYAVHFGRARVSNLSLIGPKGEIMEGLGINVAAFAIHAPIHHARPDVNAVAHAHGVHGKAWSTLGRLLDPLTQDACAFYEDHAFYEGLNTVIYDTEEGELLARALGDKKALILRNHGNLTVGKTVDEAAWWYLAMERSCHAQLLAEAAGKPMAIPREEAVYAREQGGTAYAGWVSFQPLYDMIVSEEPELLT
jgi:ribulose-5-phosphate 4-epimerase/fuculose-1-phosphate aldolase